MGEGMSEGHLQLPNPLLLSEASIATTLQFTSSFAHFCFPHGHSSTSVAQLQEHGIESPGRVWVLGNGAYYDGMQTIEKNMSPKLNLSRRTIELLSSKMEWMVGRGSEVIFLTYYVWDMY